MCKSNGGLYLLRLIILMLSLTLLQYAGDEGKVDSIDLEKKIKWDLLNVNE